MTAKFRDWYEQRHGAFPGFDGEPIPLVLERMCNSVADYVDEITVALTEQNKAADQFKGRPGSRRW